MSLTWLGHVVDWSSEWKNFQLAYRGVWVKIWLVLIYKVAGHAMEDSTDITVLLDKTQLNQVGAIVIRSLN